MKSWTAIVGVVGVCAALSCVGRPPTTVGEGEGEGEGEATFTLSAVTGRLGVQTDGTRVVVTTTGITGSPDDLDVVIVRLAPSGALARVDTIVGAEADERLVDAAIAPDGQVCVLSSSQAAGGASDGLRLDRVTADGTTTSKQLDGAAAPAFVAVDGDGCVVHATFPALQLARIEQVPADGRSLWTVDVGPGVEAGPIVVVDGVVVAVSRGERAQAAGVDTAGISFSGSGDSPSIQLLRLSRAGALIDFHYKTEVDLHPHNVIITSDGTTIGGGCGGQLATMRACVARYDVDGDFIDNPEIVADGAGRITRVLKREGGIEVVGRVGGGFDAVVGSGGFFDYVVTRVAGNLGQTAIRATLRDDRFRDAGWIPSSLASNVVDAALDVDGETLHLVAVSGVAVDADGNAIEAPTTTSLLLLPTPAFSGALSSGVPLASARGLEPIVVHDGPASINLQRTVGVFATSGGAIAVLVANAASTIEQGALALDPRSTTWPTSSSFR